MSDKKCNNCKNCTCGKSKEKINEVPESKCIKCQYYNKETKICDNGHNCKSDFATCNDFLINEKLSMF